MQKHQQSAAMGEGIWIYNVLHCVLMDSHAQIDVIVSLARIQNLDSQTLVLPVLFSVTTQGALEL